MSRRPQSVNILGWKPLVANKVASASMGILIILKTIHESLQSAFADLPEISLLIYCALLCVFSSTVCTTYLVDASRIVVFQRLGPFLMFSGLFAEFMLLITPLMLLKPCHLQSEDQRMETK